MVGRVGGIIQVSVNGEVQQAKGNWSYNLGLPKRDPVIGEDGIHGYTEKPQVAFIEGEITDRGDLDLQSLASLTDSTITIRLANGKMVSISGAWFAGEGTAQTQEGNVSVRFESANQGQES